MVAAQGRLKSLTDRVTQDQTMSRSGEVNNFKIYVEVGKEKSRDTLKNATKEKSIPGNSGSYLFNNSKRGIKNLEKSKSKPDKTDAASVNLNAGRKVLADIGNVKHSFLKAEPGKSSRTGKVKSETVLYRRSQREAVDSGGSGARASDKPSRESLRTDPIEVTDDNQTIKKMSAVKSTKASSDEPRTKFQSRNSVNGTATCRKSNRIPLHLPRNSLPVLKQASQVETSGMAKRQGNSTKSDNLSGKHGFSVKPSVRRSIVPRPSNLSSRPLRNRVSDGFVVTRSRALIKVEDGVSSRKSVKPTVRTTIAAPNTWRNSKLNGMSTKKKMGSRPTDLSKRKQDKASVSKNIPSVVIHEGPVPNKDTSGSTVARKKSDRRNSFTSSLMSRSKLVKECSKVASRDSLPNIYDDRNPLEVCDYVDDIYQYYWVLEGQNPILKNYMETQRDITPQMRGILINWLIEVHQKFDLMEETLFLTVTLLDRYLSLDSIMKNEMQLVGLTALLLASKYEDFWHPRVTDLISISAESYTRDQMLNMEKTILKKLKFRLNEPTPYVYMLRFLKAAQSDMKFQHLAFYLIELCLVEYEALNYKPSMLCASAIYVARRTMQINPPWTPLLAKHSRYEESQLRGCAEMIVRIHKAAKTSMLKVIYEKYMKPDYFRVATISPLNRLPA